MSMSSPRGSGGGYLDDSYVRFEPESQESLLGEEEEGDDASSPLAHSMLWGLSSVLNKRDAPIAEHLMPEEEAVPVDEVERSQFWSANPNHSVLLINDLKHKGQVGADDSALASQSVSWNRLLMLFLLGSFLLPLYVYFSFRRPGVAAPSGAYRLGVFLVGTAYWVGLWSMAVLFLVGGVTEVSATEILLPLALHFFCFFVDALMRSTELKRRRTFDMAADRMMCKMKVTGVSYFEQDAFYDAAAMGLADSGKHDLSFSGDESGLPEDQNLVQSPAIKPVQGKMLLKDLVNQIMRIQATQADQGINRSNLVWLRVATVVCSALYAALPHIVRAIEGIYARPQPTLFWVLSGVAVPVNFMICFVTLNAIANSVDALQGRVEIAHLFARLTSKTAASVSRLFHLELQSIENIWGWLTLRSYFLRKGKVPLARIELILSASLAFLAPLSLVLLLDFISANNSRTVFVVTAFFFAFVLACYLLIAVFQGVRMQVIYKDTDVLLAEQLAIHYRICTTRDPELSRRLKDLHAAIAKIIQILNHAADGVGLRVLGFSINQRFSQVLTGGIISLAASGISTLAGKGASL